MTIEEVLTIKSTNEVAAPEADPPSSALENISSYQDFFTRPELYERIHVHLVGVRAKKGDGKGTASNPDKAGIPTRNIFGFHSLFSTVDPLVVVETVGLNTGSSDFFPIGKHEFATLTNTAVPIWDSKCLVISKKGNENTTGIKLTMYNRKKDEGAIILQCSVPTTDFPAAAGDDGDAGWKEFVVDADSPNETQTFDGLEFVFKIRVTACTDLMSSKTDLSDFYQDTDGITYSEEVIRGEDKQDDIGNALLQCWRHNKKSSRAVLWFLGRNDCFMHPHVAKALFVENGYDVYVLNYSCVGLCRKRGWVKANYNSHCRTGNFDLYDSQIEGAISIMKSHIIEYKEVIGYAHSTGGPVLMNYLIKNGDDFFNGFIFNSPFLDWGHVGGDIAELVLENGFGFLKRLNILGNDSKFNVVKTAPDPDHPDADDFKDHTPIQYMDDEIVISAWSAKLWSQYFFDFRCRPLYSVPLTVGFVNGVTRVQNKIMKLKEDKKYITIKPFVCITSRADDTLEAEETLSRIDAIGPSRCEIELRHNAHDVFLSEEKSDVKMALEMTKSWMKANGFE